MAQTPPAPITVRAARLRDHWLWIACGVCRAGRVLEVAAIPDRFDQATIRDLHYGGRFRCIGCGRPASATMVQSSSHLDTVRQLERWAADTDADRRQSPFKAA